MTRRKTIAKQNHRTSKTIAQAKPSRKQNHRASKTIAQAEASVLNQAFPEVCP
jgi:hypothetical protein